MKKHTHRFIMYVITVYLSVTTLNTAALASQPAWGNGAHFHGVINGPANKQYSGQFPNRHYAQSSAANLNAGEPYTVRLIYFLPSDRTPIPDIDTKLDTLIKNVQKFYADEMERHGFGGKTFAFETDAAGNARVHHLDGRFASSYYLNLVGNVFSEVTDLFDISRNINVVAVDAGWPGGVDHASGGSAFVYIDRDRLDTPYYLTTDGGLGYVTAHELGHVFGLNHDFRDPTYIMAYRRAFLQQLSRCNAKWLDAVRYFNAIQTSFNEPTTIQILPVLLSPPNAIRLRFEVTDADGLHQAQLLIPTTVTDPAPGTKSQGCKSLNGQSNTIEFTTTKLTTKSNEIWLGVIDVNGNWTFERFLIDITNLLPTEVVVSVPDANLAGVLRQALGLAPSDAITQLGMLELTRLDAQVANVADLTGLDHAINLVSLNFWISQISDLRPLAGLTNLTNLYLGGNPISDISSMVELVNLTELSLGLSDISNISPVAELTNLAYLDLGTNSISDISAVAGLTNLETLTLHNNSISNISALAGLTKLKELNLGSNNISDISPLAANTELGKGDWVYLWGNPLSYQSIHTHIPTLQNRGVTVEFDNRPHPALLKISGDNQKGAAFASLAQPFVIEAQDENGSALVGISVTFAVTAGGGTLSTTITRTNPNGRAQGTLTLGPNLGTNAVEVSAAGIVNTVTFYAISDTESPPIKADVNSDGSVNILDLIVVASEIGNTGTNLVVDVNRDGVVSILDLILVAGMFDGAAAAPSAQLQVPETLTAVEVQGWLVNARSLEVKDSIMKRGFAVLEQLLISLTPIKTELLANYPNPFNPETWIPYRLAEDGFVTLTIYDTAGQIVRTLEVGHRIAAVYESRSKAIHWDGRNDVGERVASGVYFYHLSAGRSGLSVPHRSDYAATRKMLILK